MTETCHRDLSSAASIDPTFSRCSFFSIMSRNRPPVMRIPVGHPVRLIKLHERARVRDRGELDNELLDNISTVRGREGRGKAWGEGGGMHVHTDIHLLRQRFRFNLLLNINRLGISARSRTPISLHPLARPLAFCRAFPSLPRARPSPPPPHPRASRGNLFSALVYRIPTSAALLQYISAT